MNRKTLYTLLLILIAPLWLSAQSSTTEALQEKYSDALNLFFYNNTLRMLNQSEDKEFDALIKDIEKMRFLMIKKDENTFGDNDFERLVAEYKAEKFEEAMTSRHDGKNFDVYLKAKNGITNGMLILINDSKNLYVLDILGRIALDEVTKLYSTLDESADIGSKIRAFTGNDDDDDEDDDDGDDNKSDTNH